MIMAILEFRTRVCRLYQKFQIIIEPVFKFIIAFIAIRTLTNVIGYDSRLASTAIILILSLLCAFTPPAILVLVCLMLMVVHVFSMSMILAAFTLIVLLILYCLFVRFAPKYGYAVIAIPILFLFRIPYMVPILLGLLGSPIAILPMACGVFVYYLIDVIQTVAAFDLALTADDVLLLFDYVIDDLIKNQEMAMTILIFSLVTLVVYCVRRLQFDYSFEISVAIGMVVNVFGFLVMDSKLNMAMNIGEMILYTLLSGIVVLVVYFFKRVLDYTAVEKVQFEDEDYYYYVRAVPKINISMQNIHINHINEKKVHEAVITEEPDDDESIVSTGELDKRLLEKRMREAQTHDVLMYGAELTSQDEEKADEGDGNDEDK